MLRFGKIKLEKEEFYGAKKIKIKAWDVHVNHIVISKLVQTENKSQQLIGYSDRIIRQLVLILRKISGNVKTFKDKVEIRIRIIKWCLCV